MKKATTIATMMTVTAVAVANAVKAEKARLGGSYGVTDR
jgi:hypothetical protein